MVEIIRLCENPKCQAALSAADSANLRVKYCSIECRRQVNNQKEKFTRSKHAHRRVRSEAELNAAAARWQDDDFLQKLGIQIEEAPSSEAEYVADPSVAYPDEKEEETGK